MLSVKKDLLTFILAAFLLPLISSLLIITFPMCQSGICYFTLLCLEGASPTLAVIITIRLRNSPIEQLEFLRDKYISNVSIKCCMMGFLIPALILTLGKLLINLVMVQEVFWVIPSKRKLMIIFSAFIAEELGWRGYLQEKLEMLLPVPLTPLFVGLIWTCWHYHFFLIGTMDVPFLAFTYGCIIESYGYYALTKISKGNIIPASLWHFSGNLFSNLYLLGPQGHEGSLFPYLLSTGLSSVYILFFYLYYRTVK